MRTHQSIARAELFVADQYYFIAHEDRAGKARLHHRAIGLGLAAGLLGELVISGHVDIHDAGVYVMRRDPPPDALAHRTLSLLMSQPQHRDIRVWLAYFAESATVDVAERLTLGGFLREIAQRRFIGTRRLFLPVDANVAAWQAIRLERLLCARQPVSIADAYLAAVVASTGLTWHVLWDTATSLPGVERLPHLVRSLPGPLRELASFTEVMVGQVVLAPR